jgi:hypothetical protein
MADRPLTTPAGRYPGARASRVTPRAALFALVTALVIGIVLALAFYARFGRTEIETGSVSFDLVNESTVTMSFSVTRADPSRPVVCIVRARSKAADETGRREILVPASDAKTAVVFTEVRTSRPPVVAEVYGCGYDVPDYLKPAS